MVFQSFGSRRILRKAMIIFVIAAAESFNPPQAQAQSGVELENVGASYSVWGTNHFCRPGQIFDRNPTGLHRDHGYDA